MEEVVRTAGLTATTIETIPHVPTCQRTLQWLFPLSIDITSPALVLSSRGGIVGSDTHWVD